MKAKEKIYMKELRTGVYIYRRQRSVHTHIYIYIEDMKT